jgi:formylglycine-generating enzyme required for sulfatase activity
MTKSKRDALSVVLASALVVGTVGRAFAASFPAGPVKKCAADAVVAGTACVDKYEASVWRVPDPLGANKSLVKKIKDGKATQADLTAGGATQLGTASDNYAPCADNGQNCANDIYAVSLPGVTPAAFITWFQAQEACANSGKRLPTNAEWQMAATGTPDTGGGDNGTTTCNTDNLEPGVGLTGSRSICVSTRGAFDMIGNVNEFVAEWAPVTTGGPGWGAFSDDFMIWVGASTTDGPAALVRGGAYFDGAAAGPLAVAANQTADGVGPYFGFRCAR